MNENKLANSVINLQNININDEWESPKKLVFDFFKKHDLHPVMDVAASHTNHLLDVYFTKYINAFHFNWTKDFYMNPPYSDVGKWVARAYDQHKLFNVTGIALIYAKVGNTWWHKYIYDSDKDIWLADFYPIKHRLQFTINGIVPRYCFKKCKKMHVLNAKRCPDCGNTMRKNFAPYDSCFVVWRKSV